MSATFRGKQVVQVSHDRKRNEYRLYGNEGEEIATLSRHEFLSQPVLRQVPYGRHRRAASQVHCGPVGQPYISIPIGAFVYAPLGTTWRSFDSAPTRPIEDAGIRAGEIIAHRAWRVRDGRLFSVYRDEHEWIPGTPMQGDVRKEYGVHAFRGLELVSEYAAFKRLECIWSDIEIDAAGNIHFVEPPTPVFAFGTVALWGEVVEHERGYRAEFAKINSIDSCDDATALENLQERYGVSVLSRA